MGLRSKRSHRKEGFFEVKHLYASNSNVCKFTRNVLNKKFTMESVIEVNNVIKVTATLLLFLRFLQ